MTTLDQIEKVQELVQDYYEKNSQWCGLESLSSSEKIHIVQIGTSILCTKWNVGYSGGGFVQSFVSNDLMGALGSADSTSLKGLKFFAALSYNVGRPNLN